MKIKILSIFGTRPEAIKMAPLIKMLEDDIRFETYTCVTAQHREMLDQVLNFFEIEPDFDLNLMKQDQSIYDITSKIILSIQKVIKDVAPDYVLVHGDTTTSMASSISAFYERVKIGHVEAGLRTNNLYSPFPEEANRQIISVLSSINFVPTLESEKNLLIENKKNIYVTGNTVIDALHLTLKKLNEDQSLRDAVQKDIEKVYSFSAKKKIILVTGHRRENFGEGFLNICNALKIIAKSNENVDIVYPVHLNPNVREPVNKILSNIENIYLIEPLSYETFIFLMKECYMIITDSGGIQEEAPSIGKPVLVMRDTSERPEAVDAGTAILVGTDTKGIVGYAEDLIKNSKNYIKMSEAHNPYGDGKASKRIIDAIYKDHLG